jgi:hypothetical protein
MPRERRFGGDDLGSPCVLISGNGCRQYLCSSTVHVSAATAAAASDIPCNPFELLTGNYVACASSTLAYHEKLTYHGDLGFLSLS